MGVFGSLMTFNYFSKQKQRCDNEVREAPPLKVLLTVEQNRLWAVIPLYLLPFRFNFKLKSL